MSKVGGVRYLGQKLGSPGVLLARGIDHPWSSLGPFLAMALLERQELGQWRAVSWYLQQRKGYRGIHQAMLLN